MTLAWRIYPSGRNKSDMQLGKINFQIVVDIRFDGITEGMENRAIISSMS